MPLTFIEPMQPTLIDEPVLGEGWVHEVKWDGYRTQIVIEQGIVRVFTRRGFDWALRYKHIAAEASNLPCQSAIIDGEVILADPAGASDFAGLRAVLARNPAQLTFVAFDLLHLDGKDLRGQPLAARREAIQNLTDGPHGDRIQFSQSLPGTGPQVFEIIERAGLEGIVSKRTDAPYVSGRSKHWLKVKAFEEADMELLGVARERGKPAIAFLAHNGRYVGRAFITLNSQMRERLWLCVENNSGPVPEAVPAKDANRAQWLKPGLVGRVRFLKGEERLRHATLTDWREIE